MSCFELIFGVIDTNRAAADNLCATHFECFKSPSRLPDDLIEISCVRARKFFPKSYFVESGRNVFFISTNDQESDRTFDRSRSSVTNSVASKWNSVGEVWPGNNNLTWHECWSNDEAGTEAPGVRVRDPEAGRAQLQVDDRGGRWQLQSPGCWKNSPEESPSHRIKIQRPLPTWPLRFGWKFPFCILCNPSKEQLWA